MNTRSKDQITLGFLLTPAQKLTIRLAAARAGKSLSTYSREAVLAKAEKDAARASKQEQAK